MAIRRVGAAARPCDLGDAGGAGFFGAAGHFLLILAHRHVPASVLAPFTYAQIIGMVTLGYLVFGHVPSPWTFAGAAIIIASGLYLLAQERKA
ncbi:DMT family transporter [Skermanella pratensis]|uniref:DMT family transporter n=1 Tax=Skermanella pratensis TaxID=2233999 RepID=UPI001787FFD2|nr:DMT family transporter [Skermanella pratensis]